MEDGMRNLRAKLWLGFGGMLSILTVVSVLGIVVITLYSRSIDKILLENYRSVVYGEKMLEALEQLTNDAQTQVFGGPATTSAGALSEHRDSARKLFTDNLQLEHQNITVPGEQEAADHLSTVWVQYGKQLDAVQAAGISEEERRSRYETLLQRRNEVKAAAQLVIDMNLENMVSVNGQAKAWASRSRLALYIFLAAGLLLSGLLIALAGRWILQPLRTLTRSARDIEAGNLNLVVPVRSRDEVGQLAEAFNSMAAKLRAFRETDQAKLLRTQQTTQLAIDSLPDAVAVINPEGVIELTNGTATRLFNLKPQSSVHDLNLGWLVDLFRTVRDQQRTYEPQGYQNALQVFDNGTEKFFLPQGVPIKDALGKLAGVTLVLIDVTRLRQIDEIKSSLVSTVSHELRTPLTSIRLANHLLLSDRIGSLSPKQTEVVMESRDNADRLQKIIENLLDMSRIEAGQSALQVDSLRPHELANEAADQVHGAAKDKGIDMQVNVPVELPRVRADRARVNHVMLNLLNNAIRYTPPGGRISVDAAPVDGFVEFSVHDTGQGISKEYQPRVFERFFRAPGQTTGGVGLGLAIAKEIVQAHGGTIRVESKEGQGALFRFTLPQVPAVQEVTS
jgi:two-component system, NtrC family, sensor histidine kinase KinB